ncbi:MAG: hypothetical protein COA78_06745 [Blastopirellula sp.]|nr:MAG: hypothetical protein COA78_06745 [Blastopirellula sp.]
MKAELIEKYIKLSDLKVGQIAVSRDRKNIFLCAYEYKAGKNYSVIVELNNLGDQYTDNRDMSQPVRVLASGDRFVIDI